MFSFKHKKNDSKARRMVTPWYGQQGPAAGVPHHHQSLPMNHSRYHHVGAGGPGLTMNNNSSLQNQQAFHRSSPPINNNRPPSSASTSSASSYVTAPGPLAPGQGINHNQNKGMSPLNVPPGVNSFGVHPSRHSHQGGGVRPMPGGYPMPPRNNGVGSHLIRPIPRGPIPSRQQQHHHHRIPPPGAMRHPQFGTNHMPGGQTLVRHHDHHRRFVPMNGSAPYHNNGGPPGAYPYPVSHHHIMQQQQTLSDQKFPRFTRQFDSPETTTIDHQALSRSPSPPPPPPSAGESSSNQNDERGSPPVVGRVVSEESSSSTDVNPLQERNNLQEENRFQPVKKENREDATADAASILLQLGVMMKKGGNSEENAIKEQDSSNQENKSQASTFSRHTTSLPPPSSNVSLGLTESHSCDRSEITHDSAPDLTSEPSTESTESESSDFPAPIPENYPTRLALPCDDSKLNSLHCFLRSELLEIFVVQKSMNKSPTHSPGSSVGRVGLRCVHCALVKRQREDRDEAPMAVFYPKSIAEIYRLVTSWQRCHLRKCRNLPPAVRSKWQSLRDTDKSRGKTHYWVTSAKEIGLIDCHSRAGGIRFGPNTMKSGESTNESSDLTSEAAVSSSETKMEATVPQASAV